MSIKKRYYKTKPLCSVTFTLDKTTANSSREVAVVGEFNDWHSDTTPMKKLKDGSFKATVELEPGREYQFRYLLDRRVWTNESEADRLAPTQFHDAKNSVISI